ncbi:MAG TPA: 23S rRNA (uracil(1939)-C(5))-methyltransferase RlmD [Bacteroidota bacterium]|nr:23S rRNA (uracil(1939)-C(5))-methyltransferase RlmD [Bacteroidota bacterium]
MNEPIALPVRGDILELEIESSGFEGTSIARHHGIVVFVEGAVAGDRVKARVWKTKKKHVEAKVIEVVSPSLQRTEPKCKHFGVCGGCKWQHVKYASQLEFKRQHVIDALERIGGFKDVRVLPTLASGEEYYYRNKLEFSFGTERWITHEENHRLIEARIEAEKTAAAAAGAQDIDAENAAAADTRVTTKTDDFVVGFHAPQRYDKIIDIDECHLQSPLSVEILRAVKEFALARSIPAYSSETQTGYFRNLVIREGKRTGDVMVNVVTYEDDPVVMRELTQTLATRFPTITTVVNNVTSRKSQVAVGETEQVYLGDGKIRELLGTHRFEISANSFFQTNSLQAARLYEVAKEYGELKPTDLVYDLYCGAGSISLFIADAVRQVVGIELVETSITNARMNAEANGITNCEFIAGDLKDLLTKDVAWRARFANPDVLIIDPPRSGMHPKAVAELGAMKIERIVYVSCNPATLARDLQMFAPFGYVIEQVQPVDMFPHTYHIECVAKLRRVV